jgi:hypothetical protein
VGRNPAKVGDVLQFDLPDGTYVYGRVWWALYADVARAHPVVGHDPSGADEEDWPPPMRIRDPIDGTFSIYYRGEIRPATEDECRRLETAAVWDEHHLIARLTS